MTTPQSPTGSRRGLSIIARTVDLQGSDGDSRIESRRNFSLSSREHKGEKNLGRNAAHRECRHRLWYCFRDQKGNSCYHEISPQRSLLWLATGNLCPPLPPLSPAASMPGRCCC